MTELSDKRTYNTKVFDLGSNKRKHRTHVGHVHYFNKLGVGDGEQRFREIDWTLEWDDLNKGWTFQYHSFQPFIPEYADDWIRFRDLFQYKDQTIAYKAIASHVKGRLIPTSQLVDEGLNSLTGVNCVIYDDAFGEGLDYIIYFTRSQLSKVVRIRKDYKQNLDMSFDFEIDIPLGKSMYRANTRDELKRQLSPFDITENKKVYKVDRSRSKQFDSDKTTMIGNDLLDGSEWFTYLKTFKVWDSAEIPNTSVIKVDFIVQGNKTILRKNVTAKFLQSSTGDVFTDTTTSYYSGAGDGWVKSNDVNWDTVHDLTTANQANGYTETTTNLGSEYYTGGAGTKYYLTRCLFPVPTSDLPEGITITDASFWTYQNNTGSTAITIGLVETNQADPTSVVADDFDNVGSVDSPAEGATRVTPSTSAGWVEFVLNATGISWIDTTGYTLLGLRVDTDLDDSAPSDFGTRHYRQFYASEQTGTSEDPYLEITYSVGGGSTFIARNVTVV